MQSRGLILNLSAASLTFQDLGIGGNPPLLSLRLHYSATAVPAYDVVSYGSIERGYCTLCTRCFNAEVASALGLEHFEHVRLEPVVMTD